MNLALFNFPTMPPIRFIFENKKSKKGRKTTSTVHSDSTLSTYISPREFAEYILFGLISRDGI